MENKPRGGFGLPGNGKEQYGRQDEHGHGDMQPYQKTSDSSSFSGTSFNYHSQTYDVYVGHIPREWTEDKMWEMFLPYGKIKSISFIENAGFKNDKKIAFVRYSSENDARSCVEILSSNQNANPLRLHVNMASRNKNKDRPSSSEHFQGRKTYTDLMKKNYNDSRQNKPQPFDRRPGGEYGGGYSGGSSPTGQKNAWNSGYYNNQRQNQERSGGYYHNEQRKKLDHSIEAQQPRILREEVLLVTEVESSVTFWGQVGVANVAHNLAQSSDDLQAHCPTAAKACQPHDKNKVYGGVYPLDNLWYRCSVLKISPHGKVKVKFIDYGNVETIDQSRLVEIPSSLSDLPPFAHLYQLTDCSATTDPSSAVMTNPLALEQLKNLINGKLVNVKVVSENRHGIIGVIVDHPDIAGKTINDVMVAGGCVQRVKQSGGGIIERNVAEKPLSNGNNCNSNEAVRNREMDNMRKTIKFQSETICNLNKLFEAIKLENEQLNQAMQQAFSQKVKFLLSAVENLDKTRDNSMLCKERIRIINDGIKLVNDTTDRLTLENVGTFSKVCLAAEAVRLAQESIRGCEDKDRLPVMIEERNKAKQELLENIKEFLQEISSLDLNSRENKLQAALQDLHILHQPVESKEEHSLSQAIKNYNEWKTNHNTQMNTVRKDTDIVSSRLAGEFAKLQKLLDPTVNFGLDECGQVNLDSMFVQFNEAVTNERLQVQASEGKESVQVFSVLLYLLQSELQQELCDIFQLRASVDVFTEMQENLVGMPKEPDVSNLLNVRKKLKGVKSKFRHKLADCRDLEEGDELNDGEELKKVEKDLMELREELHQCLCEEKVALEEVSALAANYFPEIPLQYPEFGLQKFMQTQGLVRQGWELSYYSHHEMIKIPSSSNGHLAFVTTFNGQPCALKEYNLANITDINSFESRAVAFANVKGENIMELQALFYDKTNRKAFLQTPYYATNLRAWLETNPCNKAKRDVIRDILKALAALHQTGVIHCSILMENIFVHSNNQGILGDYCFAYDISKRVFSTEEILLKGYPEKFNGSQAFDMHCLGEITWKMFLGDGPAVKGLNLLDSICQDCCMKSMLTVFLALNGDYSPSAAEMLTHRFFVDDSLFELAKPEQKPGASDVTEQNNETEMKEKEAKEEEIKNKEQDKREEDNDAGAQEVTSSGIQQDSVVKSTGQQFVEPGDTLMVPDSTQVDEVECSHTSTLPDSTVSVSVQSDDFPTIADSTQFVGRKSSDPSTIPDNTQIAVVQSDDTPVLPDTAQFVEGNFDAAPSLPDSTQQEMSSEQTFPHVVQDEKPAETDLPTTQGEQDEIIQEEKSSEPENVEPLEEKSSKITSEEQSSVDEGTQGSNGDRVGSDEVNIPLEADTAIPPLEETAG